jgi:hypothetical protein
MKKGSGCIDCVVIVSDPIISIEFDLSIFDVFTSSYSSHIPVSPARSPKALGGANPGMAKILFTPMYHSLQRRLDIGNNFRVKSDLSV